MTNLSRESELQPVLSHIKMSYGTRYEGGLAEMMTASFNFEIVLYYLEHNTHQIWSMEI